MRKSMALAALLLVLLFLVPWLRAGGGGGGTEGEGPAPEEDDSRTDAEAPSAYDSAIHLRVLIGGEVQEMDMAEYLRGVVRAEMPASFEEEALKAQAVAARTYTLYRMEHGGSASHPEADACDDVNCCKAYRSAQEAAAGWGISTGEYEEKIRRAVAETDGQVVLYDGAPVLAAFHSSSAGATRNVEDVWQQELPYLRGVTTPEGADSVPNYYSEETFTLTEFRELFIARYPTANLSGTPSNWFTNIHQTENGAVETLQVGGITVTGGELRSLLGLRSASFTISFTDNAVTFSVTGYGHGVGMSQYGANVMAQEGKTCEEILTWYYTGTTVGLYTGSAGR